MVSQTRVVRYSPEVRNIEPFFFHSRRELPRQVLQLQRGGPGPPVRVRLLQDDVLLVVLPRGSQTVRPPWPQIAPADGPDSMPVAGPRDQLDRGWSGWKREEGTFVLVHWEAAVGRTAPPGG